MDSFTQQIILLVANAILGGTLIVTLVTLRAKRKKANEEAKAAELENNKSLMDSFNEYIGEPIKKEVNEDELVNRGDVRGGFLTRDYVSKMNVMREDGSLLGEEWFDEVVPDVGFFRVRFNHHWRWIKLSGEIIQRHTIKLGCVLVYHDGKYAIHHSFGDRLTDYFTSIMWSDNGIWNVKMISGDEETCFLHGEGGEIIYYAHEILIKNDVIALLEKDNVWYSFDLSKKLTPCFRWNPQTETK